MRKFTALLLATAALLALSCKEPAAVTPELKLLSPEEVSMTREGGETFVKFETNVAWTASVNQTKWATISKTAGGAGSSSIRVTLLMNGSEDERNCEVTIKAEDKIAVVKIRQSQRDAIYIDPMEYRVDGLAQTLDVKILANTGYTAESKADWIRIVDTKACVESTLSLDIEANGAYEEREGSVIVKGAQNMELHIIQAAKIPVFTVNGQDSDVITGIARTGGVTSLTISTNVDYSWQLSETPWVSVSALKDQFDANVGANAAHTPRQAYIKFTVPDIQDPVLDAKGNATGKTTDHVVYAFFNQEGHSQLVWQKSLSSLKGVDCKPGAIHRLAVIGNQLGLSDGKSISFLDSTNGNVQSSLACPAASFAADDAGNILVAETGQYGSEFKVYRLAKDGTKEEFIRYMHDELSSTMISNVRVKGNIDTDAVIVALTDVNPYAVCWEVKSGELQEPICISLPSYANWEKNMGLVWNCTRNGCAVPAGNSLSDGLICTAYSNWNTIYYIDAEGIVSDVHLFNSSDNENYNCIATATWGEKEFFAFGQGQLFAQGRCPDFYLVDKEACEHDCFDHSLFGISTTYLGTGDGKNASSDIALAVENDKLAVYVVDGLADVIYKIARNAVE